MPELQVKRIQVFSGKIGTRRKDHEEFRSSCLLYHTGGRASLPAVALINLDRGHGGPRSRICVIHNARLALDRFLKRDVPGNNMPEVQSEITSMPHIRS